METEFRETCQVYGHEVEFSMDPESGELRCEWDPHPKDSEWTAGKRFAFLREYERHRNAFLQGVVNATGKPMLVTMLLPNGGVGEPVSLVPQQVSEAD